MKYSDSAMSAILLCSPIGPGDRPEWKPLTLKEWTRFLELMQEAGEKAGAVLAHGFNGEELFEACPGMWERVSGLLTRGGALALEMESMEKKGIGIVTPYDPDYPNLLRRQMREKSPPVLFYAGDLGLAGKIGIAVAGSRNVDRDGAEYTSRLAKKASEENLVIYSGGARGVDSISEQTAINSGGAAVSYVTDSLLSRTRKADNLQALINGKLLLLSDRNPSEGFSVGRAMNRNKYIYTSSYGAFVTASDYEKGGTWAGAAEALKHGWVNVFVWNHPEYAGNTGLIELGAIPYELSEEKLLDTLKRNKKQERPLPF